MKSPRAWSFLTIDGKRQYGGNTGYDDDPSSIYRYDSDVANHRQVEEGHVIVLRSGSEVLGIAEITKITSENGEKERLRCPVCQVTSIKRRSTKRPQWACRNQHLFDEPARQVVQVDTYAAHYGSTYRSAPEDLTLELLNEAVIRPSDQMSIKEIDLAKIEAWVLPDAGCREVIFDYIDAIAADSFEETQSPPDSIIDARRRVMREISLRRGQSQFRERLIKRYGSACQITRCTFPGLVEAAHIRPYAKTNDNGVLNGLLLRSDLHTLFDLYLLSVEPESMAVSLHPALLAIGYAPYDGAQLFVNETSGPDSHALVEHWNLFSRRRNQNLADFG
ncbi:HNH endonuclease [Paraburkholderia pallida]|uniref:HNH endonuclease n=1 Tax=Paraburkholderia pallida TaxID=2547399 RepID=A0A4P7CVS4_9BURK|nr:HNH endonuclease signature motif containing protein [Paraburkholderia pallida]QBR00266.1 HNH endonuclease [Paraburkholderia pallida]